jgi:membrane dipeptidase
MLIIDAHLDLAWNALQWNRNLEQSVYTLRTQEVASSGKGRAMNTVAFPEMRRGRIAVSFATLLARSTGQTHAHIDYGSPAQAYAIAQGQLAYYRALEHTRAARILTNANELKAHIAQWEAWEGSGADPNHCPPLGFVISMEGADPIQESTQLEAWQRVGLRLLGLTHYGMGRYAGGTATEYGLTDLGRALLPEMQRLGIVLDVTHCSDQAFWQALDLYEGIVLASHQNCRALVPHQRQFSDEQLKAVIARDGVIGAAFDVWMLTTTWNAENHDNSGVSLVAVVDHIDYVCQLAGNARHAALGTDLDGGFGREQSPHDLDTIADLQRIPDLLAKRGYSADDIGAIMHGNWLRLLYGAWEQ